MNDNYDIIISGLGPAGAILASLLDEKFKVLAIDKKREGGFSKPCGGLLAPDAQKALTSLGLNLPKNVLCEPQIFSVKTIDIDSGLIRHYQRMYLNLSREKFDRWLISLIPERVDVLCATVLTCEKTEEGYNVTVDDGGERKVFNSKILIGADGAKSTVRTALRKKLKTREYLSIQEWFEDKSPNPFYSCVFDSCETDCYSWSVSKDGYMIFGGAYPVKTAKQAFLNQKKKLKDFGFDFSTPLKREACLVLRPTGSKSFDLGENNLYFVGETAGFISPSSLEGISSAILSALALAQSLNESKNPQKAYRKKTKALRIKLCLKLIKCPFMFDKNLRYLVMRSNLQAIEMVNR